LTETWQAVLSWKIDLLSGNYTSQGHPISATPEQRPSRTNTGPVLQIS
jgi:hypothetical protein